MPTYLFSCQQDPQNPIEYEEFHNSWKADVECSICKEKGLPSHNATRLINSQTPGKVELSGQELTQQIKKEAADLKKQVYSSEKHYANIVGESRYQGLQQQIDRNKR